MTAPTLDAPERDASAGIGRRAVFAGLGIGAALAAMAAPGEAATISEAEAFRRLSSALTGIPADELPDFGDHIRDVLAAPGQQRAGFDALLALARDASPETIPAMLRGTALEPLARAVAAAWYTGTLGAGDRARLLSYEDALAWRAAGYDSAPSLCGGEFGHWAEPPAAR